MISGDFNEFFLDNKLYGLPSVVQISSDLKMSTGVWERGPCGVTGALLDFCREIKGVMIIFYYVRC